MKGFIIIGEKAYNFTSTFDCPIGTMDNACDVYCPVTNRLCDWDTCPAVVSTDEWWNL